MESGKKTGQRPLSFGNVFGIWILILIFVTIVGYMALYDWQALVIFTIAAVVLFVVPWAFTRLWNARLARLEKRHYHED